jgi:uncharacterized protein YbcC (UPF0753/DUF2309 family)
MISTGQARRVLESRDPSALATLRSAVHDIVRALEPVLPGQAPILNFVHHNTLHGYQHLDFERALAAAESANGIRGYLPDDEYRRFYARGRIDDRDVSFAINERADLRAADAAADFAGRVVLRREVLSAGLIFGIDPIPANRLAWSIDAEACLQTFQADLPPATREALLGASGLDTGESKVALELWQACVDGLGHAAEDLHPEDLLDLPRAVAQKIWATLSESKESTGVDDRVARHRLRSEAAALVADVFSRVGESFTLRDLLRSFTGRDLLEDLRPILIRHCGAHLDEGIASWPLPDRGEGFFAAWKRLALHDPMYALHDSHNWRDEIARLPADACDTVITQLERLGVPHDQWHGYLQRLALELPGWSGMFNWRQHNPKYPANAAVKVDLTDYLAVRLSMDHLWGSSVCRDTWDIECRIPVLHQHLAGHASESYVRFHLYTHELPEYLTERARTIVSSALAPAADLAAWRQLADMIFAWQKSRDVGRSRNGLHDGTWRLFRLSQYLGISAAALRQANRDQLMEMLDILDELTPSVRGALWTVAYEHHYQDALINGLANNHGRGRWRVRERCPEAQVVYCIDEREESVRRHLEEINPEIETFGAAGFFGIVMNWRGLDDTAVTPLCPIVATPAHEVREVVRDGLAAALAEHEKGLASWTRLRARYQSTRRNLLSGHLLIDLLAPATLLNLIGAVVAPVRQYAANHHLRGWFVRGVPTEVAITAPDDGTTATPAQPRLGFTDREQADRVAALLRNIGLADGFAGIVVLMAHGSVSLNNPHEAAHDCGACSGRHGGPNARTFAAMANRPEVRALLAERGIQVPDDTWFIGAQHNTCDDSVTWFDRTDVPPGHHARLGKLERELWTASAMSAHERCRRFASAPRNPTPAQALRHVIARAHSYSQVRPEFGHATNASAIVGRRSLSQGVFLDRRAFLISYDPSRDPEGKILEGILLAVGPVGAGINLEYYFSSVDNQRFGCGTKVPHNVTGLFGVMEGASSDLRTGLPLQMVEIHEPVRLQVVVEARPEVLTAIYTRQAPLRELIGNRWLYVIAKDPDSSQFWVFNPERGFVPWSGPIRPIPIVRTSTAYYLNEVDFLPPALIEQPQGIGEAVSRA